MRLYKEATKKELVQSLLFLLHGLDSLFVVFECIVLPHELNA
jgi:hypothetical protein